MIGGSGLYSLLGDGEELSLETPFGPPSGPLTVADVGGVGVAFLPRHGPRHTLPPAAINYRANLWALRELGVSRVVAPSAAGSLQPGIRPGDFVVCDQFVDRTWGRSDTYHAAGPRVAHVSPADPYCPQLRELAVAAGRGLGITVHESGTVVVIQGPRFSSRAESRWFSAMGWQVVNMTQYPEAVLARELEMCYVNISLVTDFDAGLEGSPGEGAVSVAGVGEVLAANNLRVRELIRRLLEALPRPRACGCASAMNDAFVGG